MIRICLTFACVLLAGQSCLAQTEPKEGGFESWLENVKSGTISPAVAEPGDNQERWVAPDGRMVQLVVKTPRPLATAPTVTLPPVPAGADARPYFDRAIEKARSAKAGRLVIPKGTYLFKSLGPEILATSKFKV